LCSQAFQHELESRVQHERDEAEQHQDDGDAHPLGRRLGFGLHLGEAVVALVQPPASTMSVLCFPDMAPKMGRSVSWAGESQKMWGEI